MPNTSAGSAHSRSAKAAISERCPPEAKATASVLTVANRPAPTYSVGKYWATLTANPTAKEVASGARSSGHLMRQR